MTTSLQKSRGRSGAQRLRMAGISFVLAYGLLVAFVYSTMSFSARDDATRYITTHTHRLAAPLPPLPQAHHANWPEFSFHRDPFASLSTHDDGQNADAAQSTRSTGATTGFRFLARYEDTQHTFVLTRNAKGALTRFQIGDITDAGVIRAITHDHVTLDAAGQQRVLGIGFTENAREQPH